MSSPRDPVSDPSRDDAAIATNRLAAIVESSDDAIIGKDLNGIITSWNQGAERIFGWSAGEIVGMPILQIIPDDRQLEEAHILAKIRVGEKVSNFHTIRRAKSGELLDVSVTASPIRDASGVIVGVSKIARDVTEQRRADEARRLVEERYQSLFDQVPDGIIIAGAMNVCINANASMCRMLGYTRDELIGMNARDFVPEAELTEIRVASRALDANADYSREWQFRRKDGSTFSADVVAARMPDGNHLGLIRDITERKKLEQQMLRIQRMESIGTVAGGIAHDLNNVLAPILMGVEIVKDSVASEEGHTYLDLMRASAAHGADLVRQLLTFARGVDGARLPVDLVHIVNDVFKIMRDTFPKSIRARFEAPRGIWAVVGDSTQLHQVLLNLCVNARDAMPGGGTITIGIDNTVLDETYAMMNLDSRAGAYVKLIVEDTGEGIPPATRERIFEPFFTTKEIGKGTGLGLSTTMGIIKSHGGFIHLYSEVGVGTKFEIYLPAATSDEAAEHVALEQTGLPRGHGELILVVDDEDGIRKIVQATLERFGYRVLPAANGAEAVALFVQNQKDIALVLTDMAMPVMDGPATIVALRAISRDVWIVASSGLAPSGAMTAAVAAGVKHFVPKPYTAEAMLRTIEQVLIERGSSTAPTSM